jgi:hypothetical protein
MKYILLAPVLLVSLVSVAQQSPQSETVTPNPIPETQNPDACLVCRPCPNSSVDAQGSNTCLLCKACTVTAAAERLTAETASPASQQTYQPVVPVSPPLTGPRITSPPEWRTHSGAIDLHFETGGVFHGPTIVACDINTGVCENSGRTHIAGALGATYWITPSLGLSLDTIVMDGGSIAGVTENSVGAYLGLQFQRSRGAIRPYLEVAPGYLHSFTTGNSGAAQFNPDLASVKAGGGIRFMVGRRWGVKLGVDALPSFSGTGHQTPVTVTAGWFWQSKGKSTQ